MENRTCIVFGPNCLVEKGAISDSRKFQNVWKVQADHRFCWNSIEKFYFRNFWDNSLGREEIRAKILFKTEVSSIFNKFFHSIYMKILRTVWDHEKWSCINFQANWVMFINSNVKLEKLIFSKRSHHCCTCSYEVIKKAFLSYSFPFILLLFYWLTCIYKEGECVESTSTFKESE